MLPAMTELPGVGKAAACQVASSHQPIPLRYVWHHILPQACGGETIAANLASLCDNCHYAVHILMWHLANGGIPAGVKPSPKRLALARQGYTEALALGTEGQIPKEG